MNIKLPITITLIDGQIIEGTFFNIRQDIWGKKRKPELTLAFETEKDGVQMEGAVALSQVKSITKS